MAKHLASSTHTKPWIAGAVIVSAFFILAYSVFADGRGVTLPVDPVPLAVKTSSGEIKLKIEVADEPNERSQGMMFRPRLPDGNGMLFIFEDEDFATFWMKNTPEPLDIIFIEADGDVESIRRGEALSQATIPSQGPVRFVLELAAGQAERLGIRPGDRAIHPLIKAAEEQPKAP